MDPQLIQTQKLKADSSAIKDRNRSEKWKFIKSSMKRDKILYFMLIPGILFYITFHYIPMYGVIIAFKKYSVAKGILASQWVGLKHLRSFFEHPDSLKIIRNTILISLYQLLFTFPAPIILASLFNELKSVVFKRFVQTVSYLPHFISTVVIVGMIVNFLSPSYGIINQILMNVFGLDKPIFFLGDPEWFRTIYISSEIWQSVGWGTILYLAAIAGVDPTLYEAAKIDGAGKWHQYRHVTLVGMIPVAIILFVLNLGNMLSVGYEKIILLYNPIIYETADVINSYVYRRGLLEADYSFATAVGLFQSLIGLILVFNANRVARKYSETSLW